MTEGSAHQSKIAADETYRKGSVGGHCSTSAGPLAPSKVVARYPGDMIEAGGLKRHIPPRRLPSC